ncbi:MAG: hypothetical protein EOP50_02730 [Sphingobacteriales bacterium]|nr:MAG: hypothetical protein EOP50_02730 [Sphingobacteriales bacterium]
MKNTFRLMLCSLGIASSAHAAVITAQTGQTFTFTNASNQTFPITLVGSTAKITYTPGPYFDGVDAYTIGGFMDWVRATNTEFIATGNTSISFTFADYPDYPYNPIPFDRTHARILSIGNSIAFDDTTGKIISASGINAGTMQAPRFSIGLTGGRVEFRNLVAAFNSTTIKADADGLSNPVGSSTPARSYSLRGSDFWTYDSISQPSPLPKDTLTRSNIEWKLKNAGYVVQSVTPTRITFYSVHKLQNLRFTPDGLNLYLKSFGYLSSWTGGIKSLNTSEEGLGTLQVSVLLSMPMPAQ